MMYPSKTFVLINYPSLFFPTPTIPKSMEAPLSLRVICCDIVIIAKRRIDVNVSGPLARIYTLIVFSLIVKKMQATSFKRSAYITKF